MPEVVEFEYEQKVREKRKADALQRIAKSLEKIANKKEKTDLKDMS